VLTPFATRPAQPVYWLFMPAVEVPCFSWPVSSSAPTAIRFRRERRAAASSPAAAYLLTWLIAAASSREARFGSRCILAGRPVPGLLGDRPAVPRRQAAGRRVDVLARLQPGLRPREARPEQPRQGRPFPRRPPCPCPCDSSRLVFICPHEHMIPRRLSCLTGIPEPSRHGSSESRWRLPYQARRMRAARQRMMVSPMSTTVMTAGVIMPAQSMP
jgi:hypothetical protein